MIPLMLACFGVFGDRQGYLRSIDKPDILVAVVSRVNDFEVRKEYRRQCKTAHDFCFIVALPSQSRTQPNRHVWGQIAPVQDQRTAEALLDEHARYGDLVVLPYRDTYRDLPLKSLHLMRYAVENKYDYAVKIDDEYCINDNALRNLKDKWLYAGAVYFDGTESPLMTGADGAHHPYFSGLSWLLSASVMRAIACKNYLRSLLYDAYGSSSEDVDVSYWVHQVQMNVTMLHIPNLYRMRNVK